MINENQLTQLREIESETKNGAWLYLFDVNKSIILALWQVEKQEDLW